MKDPTGYNIVFRKVTRMFIVKTINNDVAINAVMDFVNGCNPNIEVDEDTEFSDSPEYEVDSVDIYYGEDWEQYRKKIFKH